MGTHDRDQLDDLLDGALKRYGQVEPRAGLEGRVLARVAAADRQPRCWTGWVWGLAAAGCVSAVILLVLLVRTPQSHPQRVAADPPSAAINRNVVPEVPMPEHLKRHTTLARSSKPEVQVAKARRPREFPSPHALSEQERLLKSYVSAFPQEAALVAHEQAEREKELAAMGWGSTGVPDSN